MFYLLYLRLNRLIDIGIHIVESNRISACNCVFQPKCLHYHRIITCTEIIFSKNNYVLDDYWQPGRGNTPRVAVRRQGARSAPEGRAFLHIRWASNLFFLLAAREHLPLRLSVAHSAIDHPPLGHLLLLLLFSVRFLTTDSD